MKGTLRVAGGIVALLALLAFAFSTIASAQGPTGSPTPSATNPAPGGSATPAPGAACTNVATFVTDVTIPDNAVVAPGQTFTKTWRMRNRGTCTWGAGYTFAFVSGQAMTTETSVPVPETAPVATADVSAPMTAPANAGTVQGFWQLRAPNGTGFGPRVWVLVDVRSGATGQPGAGGTPVPAQAPPLVPSGTNFDDPARATSFGTATIRSIPAGSGEWFQFNYDNGGNALPRPNVTILLLNGVTNGLSFQVYSPETMIGNWFDNTPVGKGTQEAFVNCIQDGVNVGRCTTNNLSWTGGFGLNGTYFVRVINNSGATVAPQLIISGPGLAQCLTAGQGNTAVTNPSGAFAQVQCTTASPATPAP